jgi:hypothetical protein
VADQFPAHVVTAWIGNSEKEAADHYLQITEEHWRRGSETVAASGALPAQKPSQQGAARPAQNVADLPEVLAGCEDMREAAAFCDIQEYARSDSNTRPSV